MSKQKTFVLSRTDSIGDVILTMPMAGFLKAQYPHCKVYFLGQPYTQAIVEACIHVDGFLNWTELNTTGQFPEKMQSLSVDEIIHVFPRKEIAKLTKQARIPQRTGTTNRLYHWLYCNHKIRLSRKNSDLHEAQLNLKLIQHHIGSQTRTLEEIEQRYGFSKIAPLPAHLKHYISKEKTNVILHTKSKGSAKEWGLKNFNDLIQLLPQKKYNILLTGTEEEGLLFRTALVDSNPWVTDLSGKLSLSELFSLIKAADALVACSTGPLHMAAASGIRAIGLYPPIRPMHPGRWAPVGKNVSILVAEEGLPEETCLTSIPPVKVFALLEKI